jgi:hypothetical protein
VAFGEHLLKIHPITVQYLACLIRKAQIHRLRPQQQRHYQEFALRGEPALQAEEAFAILLEKMDALRGMFAKTPQGDGIDISGFENEAHKILVPVLVVFLEAQRPCCDVAFGEHLLKIHPITVLLKS